MHIISTDEKQVFAAVQEWNQNNTYSLYISDSPGVYFTLSLENLRTSRGPAGNLLVDFYKVRSYSPSWALVGITTSIIISYAFLSYSAFVLQLIYPKIRISCHYCAACHKCLIFNYNEKNNIYRRQSF